MIIVNTTALRSGGALTILQQFVKAIPNDSFRYLLFVDESIVFDEIPSNVRIVSLNKRSFLKRFLWDAYGLNNWLKRNHIEPQIALSLQNTNFHLTKSCPNFVYYHQPLPLFPFRWNPFKTRERNLWFYKNIYPYFVKLFINSQTEVFVQLEYIKDGFSSRFNFPKNKIHVVFPNVLLPQQQTKSDLHSIISKTNAFNLFYPATSIFYKNHEILFKSFSLIDKKLPIRIVLYLSLGDVFRPMYTFENIEVISVGHIPTEDMYEWYTNMDALVFPSYIETLGLPLIEAASVGLPIIASDLPYAHEVLKGYEGVKYVDYADAEVWGNMILALASAPKAKFSSFFRENNNSWNNLFQIIKQTI